MKVAVVFPTCSTGGAKYLYLLLKSIIKLRPDFEITIWHNIDEPYAKNLIVEELTPLGVKFEKFDTKRYTPNAFEKNDNNILFKVIKFINRELIKSKIVKPMLFDQFDLFFCPWPYDFPCPNVGIPMICVPHDFNYIHHFGMSIYKRNHAEKLMNQHRKWFKKATPVVSTNFMASELKKAVPQYEKDVDVVHLSTLNDFEKLDEKKVDKILSDFGIEGDYILSANSICYHKNFNILYSGYYYLKEKYPNVKLVLVGFATAGCRGKSNSPYYIDAFSKDEDVKGLGLVSDESLVALMQRAKMVVNTSLYEAGNGSGLDAWGLGVPVVMSDIEPFNEQMDILGVKAQTFDPQSGKDMARAMIKILDNPEQTQRDVEFSKTAIAKYNWDKVAQKYIQIFERVVKEGK